MIQVNPLPTQKVHVGACGGPDGEGPGWPVVFVASENCTDVSTIANARLQVKRPLGSDPETVTWDLTVEAGTSTRREAFYKFKGVDVAQSPPDLPVHGKYIGFVEVDFGDGIFVRFGDDMVLTVTPNP